MYNTAHPVIIYLPLNFSLLSSLFSLLHRPNGRTLQVSYTYNIDELCEVQKGAVVTFSYVTFDSDGIPTFPKIHRVRHDVRWRDLVDDSTKLSLTSISHTSVYSSLPPALHLPFHDPSASYLSLLLTPLFTFLMALNSVVSKKMVSEPQVLKHPRGHWTRGVGEMSGNKNDNIRELFNSFAKSRHMDPLVAENWYAITREEFATTEV